MLSNHCHIQILDVSHDLLNGFVSGLPFSSPPSPIKNLLSPIPLGRPDTQATLAWAFVSRACKQITVNSFMNDLVLFKGEFSANEGTAYSIIITITILLNCIFNDIVTVISISV